ncbi:MAG: VanZ family protein [Nanoarchaeota archaeon]|nr:VanZ family protein [Nanoarchaeota archaeon]
MISFFEKHNKLSIIIALLIALLIFYVSTRTAEEITEGIEIKIYLWETVVYHFVIFFLLCFFLCFSLVRGKPKRKYFILVVVIITIIYGITDEIHQLFVPGRVSDMTDVLTDAAGVVLAGIIYWLKIH